MAHNHSCSCKHDNLKFCKSCQKPYCLDCHQEWNRYAYQYYPSGYTQYPYQYPYWITKATSGAGSSYQTSGYLQQVPTVGSLTPITPCNHAS
jgi:hypothetical protein